MLNLSNTCRHPENGQQYVFNGMGGKNNSPEGHDVSCLFLRGATFLAATGNRGRYTDKANDG